MALQVRNNLACSEPSKHVFQIVRLMASYRKFSSLGFGNFLPRMALPLLTLWCHRLRRPNQVSSRFLLERSSRIALREKQFDAGMRRLKAWLKEVSYHRAKCWHRCFPKSPLKSGLRAFETTISAGVMPLSTLHSGADVRCCY